MLLSFLEGLSVTLAPRLCYHADTMHPDSARLFSLDESLRAEADRMLADSGIGGILAEGGFVAVGSYAMRTMTWRDLDFERPEEAPDWHSHWGVGTRLARTGWCIRLNCTDCYRQQTVGFEPGLYWGVRAADPARKEPVSPDDPSTWKLDLWTIEPVYFQRNATQRGNWMSRLTEEARSHILAIKEAVCHEPEYRRTMLSVHVYEAVIEHGVCGAEAFREWWESRYGETREL